MRPDVHDLGATPETGSRTAVRLLKRLARAHPLPDRVSSTEPELRRALQFLGTDIDPVVVPRAGDVSGGIAGVCLGLVCLPLVGPIAALWIGAAAGLGVAVGVRRLPRWLATVRRTRALGAAPGLIARAALRLRIEPSPERAARFAAETGTGPLARSLGEHARRAAGTPRSGFGTFADAWRPWFPALDRAAALLESGAAARPAERERSLERALDTVTDGARSRLAGFVGDVRGPASGTYAFGVVLPLALAGMLPAARAAGLPIGIGHVVVLYNLLLPLVLLCASGWLLLARPVAFPPPPIPRSHPDIPTRRWAVPAAIGACGSGGGIVAFGLIGAWSAPIAAVGFGAGAGLVVRYRPIVAVREHVREIEDGLDDAMYLVGRRVATGESVERAIETAAAELPGATGELFGDAVCVGRQLRVDVHGAFLGPHGALAMIPSPRARASAALLSLAASEGKPAADAIVSLGEHLSQLRRIERESRRELASVTGTLANTAALFGPLVGGVTVALAGRMATAVEGAEAGPIDSASEVGVTALQTGSLGLAVGGYVLAMATILTTLATSLERGFDRALVGYRVGLALPAATATYLTAYVGASLVL